MLYILHSYYTSEQNILGSVGSRRWDNAGAIYQVDSLHERDVLPYFRFSGDGSHGADFLFPQRVDNGGFAGVGVADKAYADLLAVGVEG